MGSIINAPSIHHFNCSIFNPIFGIPEKFTLTMHNKDDFKIMALNMKVTKINMLECNKKIVIIEIAIMQSQLWYKF